MKDEGGRRKEGGRVFSERGQAGEGKGRPRKRSVRCECHTRKRGASMQGSVGRRYVCVYVRV